MFDRVIITFAVIGGLGLLWWGWHYYKAWIIRSVQSIEPVNGKPTLLYFSADYCLPCKLQQAPIVEQLAAKFGDSIAVKLYNVTEHPDLASQYKVLTLPTTVVINTHGQVAHINYGVTRLGKLETQLLTNTVSANFNQGVLNEFRHAA